MDVVNVVVQVVTFVTAEVEETVARLFLPELPNWVFKLFRAVVAVEIAVFAFCNA